MSDDAKNETGAVTRPDTSLMNRCALAWLRMELGIVPPARLAEARRYLESTGDQFDGRKLIDYCLEGRAGDGDAALEKAMRRLHAAVAVEPMARRPRRKTSLLVRLSATLLGRTLVFLITLVFVVVLLVLAQSLFPQVDIYAIRDTIVTQVQGILGK